MEFKKIAASGIHSYTGQVCYTSLKKFKGKSKVENGK
jgi:hypothetical protein